MFAGVPMGTPLEFRLSSLRIPDTPAIPLHLIRGIPGFDGHTMVVGKEIESLMGHRGTMNQAITKLDQKEHPWHLAGKGTSKEEHAEFIKLAKVCGNLQPIHILL
jgi:hypothetical protein